MEPEKKECILAAASRAFSRLGFKKTAISDIASAAGVAKGTVYLACKSKEDLFYQVVLRDVRCWISELASQLDPREPADRALGRLSITSLHYFEEHPLVRDLFIGVFHGEHPEWAERFEELRALGRTHVAELLRLGIRQGRFRADLDVEETAAILQDFQHAALVVQSRCGDLAPEIERRARAGYELVLRGLQAPAAAPA